MLLEPPELAEERGDGGEVRMELVHSAPKARIRVAALARETPKSASRSRRVRSGRSSASSCWMASGRARSHRGRAGTLRTGQPVAGVGVGKMSAEACLRLRLVDGRLKYKIGGVTRIMGNIKDVMLRFRP